MHYIFSHAFAIILPKNMWASDLTEAEAESYAAVPITTPATVEMSNFFLVLVPTYIWVEFEIPWQFICYEGICIFGSYSFIEWIVTLNLGAPLLLFDKSRLILAPGFSFTFPNLTLITRTLHYNTIYIYIYTYIHPWYLLLTHHPAISPVKML